jgi:hypothetical protein
LVFSAIVLAVAGVMRIFDAIWAFRYSGTPVDDLHQALFGSSLTGYGVLWLIVGIILIASAFLVVGGTRSVTAQLARWIGIAAAAIAAITAITWMPYYPVWSLVYVGVAVIVIYGLGVRFEEEPTTT